MLKSVVCSFLISSTVLTPPAFSMVDNDEALSPTGISLQARTPLDERMKEFSEEERTLLLNLVKDQFDSSSLLRSILSLPPAAIIPICRIADVSQEQIGEYSRAQYFRYLIRGAHVVSKDVEKEDVRGALNQLVLNGYSQFDSSLDFLEGVPDVERAPLLLLTHELREYLPRGSSRARLFPLLQLLPEEHRTGTAALLAQFLRSDHLLNKSSYEEVVKIFGSLREDLRAPFVQALVPLVLDRPLGSRVKLFRRSIKILSENSLNEIALRSCITVLCRVEDEGSSTNHFSLFTQGLLKFSSGKRLMLISIMKEHAEIKTETFRVALKCLRKVPEENLTEDLTNLVFAILHNVKAGLASFNIKTILESPDRLECLRGIATCSPHFQESSLREQAKEVLLAKRRRS
ncbi:hypothetical protein QPK87_33355 [Kamptonema cortianum]|nr:hypothetical protein [Geitlerinema splendidum]MDK3161405.1 hypothetical protein [Kamptonema cortianum]